MGRRPSQAVDVIELELALGHPSIESLKAACERELGYEVKLSSLRVYWSYHKTYGATWRKAMRERKTVKPRAAPGMVTPNTAVRIERPPESLLWSMHAERTAVAASWRHAPKCTSPEELHKAVEKDLGKKVGFSTVYTHWCAYKRFGGAWPIEVAKYKRSRYAARKVR